MDVESSLAPYIPLIAVVVAACGALVLEIFKIKTRDGVPAELRDATIKRWSRYLVIYVLAAVGAFAFLYRQNLRESKIRADHCAHLCITNAQKGLAASLSAARLSVNDDFRWSTPTAARDTAGTQHQIVLEALLRFREQIELANRAFGRDSDAVCAQAMHLANQVRERILNPLSNSVTDSNALRKNLQTELDRIIPELDSPSQVHPMPTYPSKTP